MEGKGQIIGQITLNSDRPTNLTFDDLYTWVIWQFPRIKGGAMCGAVKPPIANHTWYPALITKHERLILVHGHINIEFSSPNEAADWLDTNGTT